MAKILRRSAVFAARRLKVMLGSARYAREIERRRDERINLCNSMLRH